MGETAAPRLILFPRFGHAEAVREVGAAEVFMRLTQASTNYVALGRAGFDALTRLVREVPARAVDYADTAGRDRAGRTVVERAPGERACAGVCPARGLPGAPCARRGVGTR
jgi:hypothetical protein